MPDTLTHEDELLAIMCDALTLTPGTLTRESTRENVELWAALKSQTIDYGIMEGAQDVVVLPAADIHWMDVGSWDSLFDLLPGDEHGNIVVGAELLPIAATGTLVHADTGAGKLVALIGVSDLIVVDTPDVLLVCPRSRAQDVREAVAALRERPGGGVFL